MSDKPAAVAANGAVPVVTKDGTVAYLPAALANDAAATEGLRRASDTEIRGAQLTANQGATKAALDAQFSGSLGAEVEGAVMPALAGAARGLTLGGSDVALSHLGSGVRRRLLDYQDYAPGASMAGEVGAIAGAALLGDEAGLGRLPGIVSKLGAGAEAAAARGLGGGMLARGAGVLARGATEGAIYSVGKASGDAALHDEQLTTEKALTAAGHGAVFGAGANALLAGAGAGLGRLVEGAGAIRAPSIGTAVEAEAGSLRGRLGDALEKGADVKTIKALGGSAGDLRALEANVPGGFRKVAQDIRGDIETSTGKSIGRHNRESLHDYASGRVEELGDKLGGMLKTLDASGGQAPAASRFLQQAREEIISPLMVHTPAGPVVAPGAGKIVKAVDGYLSQIEAATAGRTPTFTEWQGWRRGLDKTIYEGVTKASPSVDALRQVRALMEKELEVAGEAAAKNVGGSFVEQYQATKSLYQSVKKAEELSARGVAAELGRNSVGLGATIGAATGLATGGPLAGIAMGAAGKVVKDRGDMLAADLLHRAANVMGVQSLAARTNAKMSEGIAGLLGTKAIPTGAAAGAMAAPASRSVAAPLGVVLSGNLHADFDKVSAAATKLSTNPAHLTARIGDALGPEAGKSPGMAAAITNTLMGDVAYLASKLPPTRLDTFTLQPHLQPPTRASDAEKSEYLRAARAISDPTVMLKDAKDGSLTPTTVEAIKERRPKMYAEMRTEIAQSLVTSKSELPYGRRIQLGILLDLPTDQTLAPDFVSAIQATYTASDKAGVEPPPPQLSQLDVAGSSQTATQAASGGLDR
jgi:hypothetical protein